MSCSLPFHQKEKWKEGEDEKGLTLMRRDAQTEGHALLDCLSSVNERWVPRRDWKLGPSCPSHSHALFSIHRHRVIFIPGNRIEDRFSQFMSAVLLLSRRLWQEERMGQEFGPLVTLFPRKWLWVFMSPPDKQVLSRERDLAWVSGTLNYLHRDHTECNRERRRHSFHSCLSPHFISLRGKKKGERHERLFVWETFLTREQDVLEEQRAWFRYTLVYLEEDRQTSNGCASVVFTQSQIHTLLEVVKKSHITDTFPPPSAVSSLSRYAMMLIFYHFLPWNGFFPHKFPVRRKSRKFSVIQSGNSDWLASLSFVLFMMTDDLIVSDDDDCGDDESDLVLFPFKRKMEGMSFCKRIHPSRVSTFNNNKL